VCGRHCRRRFSSAVWPAGRSSSSWNTTDVAERELEEMRPAPQSAAGLVHVGPGQAAAARVGAGPWPSVVTPWKRRPPRGKSNGDRDRLHRHEDEVLLCRVAGISERPGLPSPTNSSRGVQASARRLILVAGPGSQGRHESRGARAKAPGHRSDGRRGLCRRRRCCRAATAPPPPAFCFRS